MTDGATQEPAASEPDSGARPAWEQLKGRRTIEQICACDEVTTTLLTTLEDGASASCTHCQKPLELHLQHLTDDGKVERCLACGCRDLHYQRDFNRPLGCLIAAIAIALAVPTYYISLFVAAAIDAALYYSLPEVLACYKCRANHRGFPKHDKHEAYELERAAKYTQYVG